MYCLQQEVDLLLHYLRYHKAILQLNLPYPDTSISSQHSVQLKFIMNESLFV